MPGAARLNDAVAGMTEGEHSGHATPHSPEAFSGEISGGCSGDVFINGIPAAVVGNTTTERDSCCGSFQGKVSVGSGSVFINRKAAARRGDTPAPHNGSGQISAGSGDVNIGG
ncbi:PAAR domain-containing protein [Anaerotruncus colihominis]|uniref:PAAR domain-containing protein n=1 Tax=Anaerotruncus colihominis TaxID=169435 RepID=UPI00242F34E1|nr:PAAR domain-containing protein [Anaerotruncus colihominis]